jgi:hypothetical protein
LLNDGETAIGAFGRAHALAADDPAAAFDFGVSCRWLRRPSRSSASSSIRSGAAVGSLTCCNMLVVLSLGLYLKTSDIGQVLLWQQAERHYPALLRLTTGPAVQAAASRGGHSGYPAGGCAGQAAAPPGQVLLWQQAERHYPALLQQVKDPTAAPLRMDELAAGGCAGQAAAPPAHPFAAAPPSGP